MQINFLAIVIATVVQFAIGATWYGPLFGKLWGKIHGFDKLSKEVQEKMVKAMTPFYGLQLLVTIITTVVLALLLRALPEWNPFVLAALLWLGFIIPSQVSSVIFGGTESKWIAPKVALQAGGALLCILAATFIITMLG